MTAIVTTPFRVVNAQNFKSNVGANSVYVAIGKSDAWSTTTSDLTDTTAFTPSDRIDDLSEAYQNLIGMKKVTAVDVSHVVPRHTWTSGTSYIAWDSDDATIYDKAFYIISSEFKVYKCITAGGGASTAEPTHINTNPTAESDGYYWKYLFTVTVTDAEKFLTISYMPVNTLNFPSTSVTNGASSSSTAVVLTTANEFIEVSQLVTGAGVAVNATVAAISGTALTLSAASTIADAVTLTFGRFADTDVNYSNQTAQINSKDSSTAAGIERIEVTAGGTGYTSKPVVTITGDGTSATVVDAQVTLTDEVVTAIALTTKGTNYTVADVTITCF